jgi:hypothetical protein
MNYAEWVDRVKTDVSDEDWVVIHQVYQWHPMIPDVNGKDVLAKLYKQGGIGLMESMVPAANEAEKRYSRVREAQLALDVAKQVLQDAEAAETEFKLRFCADLRAA